MPKVRGRAKPKTNTEQRAADADREALLKEFDMMTMTELATLWGVDVKTLHNKGPKELPPHTRVGGKRLFFKEDVRSYMRKNMV